MTARVMSRTTSPSLPIRGAWIEISNACWILPDAPGRSPSGERGLKWVEGVEDHVVEESLPIRGAWIEMCLVNGVSQTANCRSPSGERGLKYDRCGHIHQGCESLPIRGAWIEIHDIINTPHQKTVAPHPGSVD